MPPAETSPESFNEENISVRVIKPSDSDINSPRGSERDGSSASRFSFPRRSLHSPLPLPPPPLPLLPRVFMNFSLEIRKDALGLMENNLPATKRVRENERAKRKRPSTHYVFKKKTKEPKRRFVASFRQAEINRRERVLRVREKRN